MLKRWSADVVGWLLVTTCYQMADDLVEGNVRMEKGAWVLAKTRRLAGDATLWNTSGGTLSVADLVHKVVKAWHCEDMSTGTVITKVELEVNTFLDLDKINPLLVEWVKSAHKTVVLIMLGDAGLGKTELACALMAKVASSGIFHFVNKVDRMKDVLFVPGQGLVVDEACLEGREIDDVKALLDVKKSRDVQCRNKDGRIPAGIPRILITNWPRCWFFPPEAASDLHKGAIERRTLWVTIHKDVRKTPLVLPVQAPGGGDDEEDVFGWGGGMDAE